MTAQSFYTTAPTTVAATIKVGGPQAAPLASDLGVRVMRVVVDSNLHLPDMFEITFDDWDGGVLTEAKIAVGTQITIAAGTPGSAATSPLITGEVTAIEGAFDYLVRRTTVRGYDPSHRLQRVRRTRTFVNARDSEIASQIASDAGLTVGVIQRTSVVHDHVGQVNQTDWEFLRMRCREIGYEFGVSDGKFYFRPASSAQQRLGAPVPLTMMQQLLRFSPRVTAANLASTAEVRVWDPTTRKVVTKTAPIRTAAATVASHTPGQLAAHFKSKNTQPSPPNPGPSQVGDLGPAPNDNAFVVNERPLATGAAISAALEGAARSLSDHLAGTFADAEGEAVGDPRLLAGSLVKVINVPAPFDQTTWLVSNATHTFDSSEDGYRVRFFVDGRQDRSLLGLTSGGDKSRDVHPELPGVYCGVVTNVGDATKKGNVKVALPWLSPSYETDWAPVMQVGAGPRSGMMFLPEVGDQVLVGFEFGDSRRPYVIGGLITDKSAYPLVPAAVQTSGQAGQVVQRGFVSPAGNMLVFSDKVGSAPGARPTASSIVLGTGDNLLGLEIDQVNGKVTLTCQPSSAGQLTIACGNAGVVNLTTGNGGSINVTAGSGGKIAVDAGAELTVKAMAKIQIGSPTAAVEIQGATVSIKGNEVQLNPPG